MPVLHFSVDGNIGVGKTTFINQLKKIADNRFIFHDEFSTVMLKELEWFTADVPNRAYEFQYKVHCFEHCVLFKCLL